MKNTTLVYIEKDNKYLMLHRTKKEHDENSGKWIGIGGHFEDGESPDECMLREVLEETGLTITKYRFRGIVTFVSDEYGTEYMHLFTANGFTGNLKECDEGELAWIDKSNVLDLNLWEGDKVFLPLLINHELYFRIRLTYENDILINAQKY